MDTFDIMLYLAYTLVIISAVAALILPLINAFGNPRALLQSGIGVLALVVIYLISFALSSDEVTTVYTQNNVGPDLSKFVGGIIIMMYLMLGIAVVSIFFTEISKLLK